MIDSCLARQNQQLTILVAIKVEDIQKIQWQKIPWVWLWTVIQSPMLRQQFTIVVVWSSRQPYNSTEKKNSWRQPYNSVKNYRYLPFPWKCLPWAVAPSQHAPAPRAAWMTSWSVNTPSWRTWDHQADTFRTGQWEHRRVRQHGVVVVQASRVLTHFVLDSGNTDVWGNTE